MKDFQQSPLYIEFIRSLGCENRKESLLSLQWDRGFCMGENLRQADDLHGRLTLTTFNIPYTGVLDRMESSRALFAAFNGFFPKGCRDLVTWGPFLWVAYSWVDDGQQEQSTAVETSSQAMLYHFLCWNGNGANAEREEASVREPGAHESWAKTVAKAMPLIEAWQLERWDIQVAQCCISSDEDEDEDEGDTGVFPKILGMVSIVYQSVASRLSLA